MLVGLVFPLFDLLYFLSSCLLFFMPLFFPSQATNSFRKDTKAPLSPVMTQIIHVNFTVQMMGTLPMKVYFLFSAASLFYIPCSGSD